MKRWREGILLVISLAWVFFCFWWMASAKYDPKVDVSTFAAGIRTFRGLDPNAIGDTLAGVFSPIAFVWFVVAVWLQRVELEDTRDVMRAQAGELAGQNAIAAAVAQSNYQLARYEHFSDVFNRVVDALREPAADRAPGHIMSANLYAERLFPIEMREWLSELEKDIRDLRTMLNEKKRIESTTGGFVQPQADRLKHILEAAPALESKLQAILREQEVEKRFSPFLTLPPEIDFKSVGDKAAANALARK